GAHLTQATIHVFPDHLQYPSGLVQVFVNVLAAIEGSDGGVLDGCRSGSEGLTGNDRHGVLQGAQFRREDKGAQTPAAGPEPFAYAGADDGAFRVVAGNGFVPAFKVHFPVDLIRQQDQVVFAGHVGDGQQLVVGVGATGRVGRVVQDQDARARRVVPADDVQFFGSQLPVVLGVGRQPVH